MKFLANENIPQASISYLKDKGYDIKSVGVDFQGYSDKEVLLMAIKESRTIITFDKDYGELIFKNDFYPEKGIIYLRLLNYSPVEPGYIIDNIIKNKSIAFENCISVVTLDNIRQRRYK